ncbi:hypothetical protein ACIRPQ_24205 [Streptomyces sp. NPDC101213]|uniref:hypothetical protein n=1 Tax=Streptomyces sp. NPDC101213 TaxID=3366130 RepID=UPI003808C818
MRRLAVAGLAAALLLLTGCGSGDAPADTGEEQAAQDTAPWETPVEEPVSEETEDTSVQDALDEAGVTDAMVRQLAAVAEANNYAATIPMGDDSARLFATVIVDHCREVALGRKTWEFYAEEDMSTGGTQAQVDAMYGFTKRTFCPSLNPEE